MPRMLREADISLAFFNPPEKVQHFLDHCKYLVEMKNMIAHAKKWLYSIVLTNCFVMSNDFYSH